MRNALSRLALLTLAFALGTYAVGWIAVPAIGFAWGVMAASTARTPARAGVAALLAWALLLIVPNLFGAPTLRFSVQLAAAMNLPWWGLWMAELVFPLAAAWGAASLAAAVAARPRTGESPAH
jgi:hypothetical protein